MIGQDAIIGWRSKFPWKSDIQIEQDLILHAIIQAIYFDPFLQKRLAFRGGTCLNKLVWNVPARYSEDLDFVQITTEKIGPTSDHIKKALNEIFNEDGEWERRGDSFRLYYSFAPESNPNNNQRIKIEINTREHFALDGYKKKKITLDSLWKSGEAIVTTFSPEELFATKVRALYQRHKGRDLFDLWMSKKIKLKYNKIVKLFLEYMKRSGKKVHRDLLVQNLEEKISSKSYLDDVVPLITPDIKYDPIDAAKFVNESIFSLVPESKSKVKKQLSNRGGNERK